MRSSTAFDRLGRVGDGLEFLPPPQVWMHHAALDRAGPHDRDLDHEIVEAARLQPRQHVHLRARFDLEHAERVAVAHHVVDLRVLGRDVLQPQRRDRVKRDRCGRAHDGCSVSMPSASTSTFSRPSASRSSLSHWITVRSSIAAFSIGTMRSSRPRAMTKPPECCDRWRGKPISFGREFSELRDDRVVGIEAGFLRAARPHDAACRPTTPSVLRQAIDLVERQAERLADVAQRAVRPVGDAAPPSAPRGRGRTCRRCTA